MSRSERIIQSLQAKDDLNSRVLTILLEKLGGSAEISNKELAESSGKIMAKQGSDGLEFKLLKE